MKNKARDLLMLFGIAGGLSSRWTSGPNGWLSRILPWEKKFTRSAFWRPFPIYFWKITGAAFGLFQNASVILLVVSIAISLLWSGSTLNLWMSLSCFVLVCP